MQALRLSDMIGSKVTESLGKIGKEVQKPSVVDPFGLKKKIEKKEGLDEMIGCLLAGDFSCFLSNLDWLVSQIFSNGMLSCSLGATTIDPVDSGRLVSSGACYTFWGIPGIGSPQACSKYDSITKSVNTCKSKCTSIGASYESAGCDGSSLWCWCRID